MKIYILVIDVGQNESHYTETIKTTADHEKAMRWWKDETDFLAYLREKLDKMASREGRDADLSRTLEELSGGKYDNWWIFTDINGYRVETCPFEA